MSKFIPILLMFVAGTGIPVMAALNANLGERLANPALAASLLCATGLLASLPFALSQGVPDVLRIAGESPSRLGAGLLLALYLLSITWAAPRIGVGNAIFIVLLGQLAAAVTIDHLALFGAQSVPISLQRSIGLAVIVLGIALTRHPVN